VRLLSHAHVSQRKIRFLLFLLYHFFGVFARAFRNFIERFSVSKQVFSGIMTVDFLFFSIFSCSTCFRADFPLFQTGFQGFRKIKLANGNRKET
jgi:hypothetical protein